MSKYFRSFVGIKKELITTLTDNFELHAQQTEGEVEYRLARDLQHLPGYDRWRNFVQVISKAKVACEVSDHEVSDHFADVGKMVNLGSGGKRKIDDIMLIKKLERRIASQEKKALKSPDSLDSNDE